MSARKLAVTLAQLEGQLLRLAVGETLLLTREQFQQAFGPNLPLAMLHHIARPRLKPEDRLSSLKRRPLTYCFPMC